MTSSTLPFPAATPTAAQLIAENVHLRARLVAIETELESARRSLRFGDLLCKSVWFMGFDRRYDPLKIAIEYRDSRVERPTVPVAPVPPLRGSVGGAGTTGNREG